MAFAPSSELAVSRAAGELALWNASSGQTRKISLSRPRYMDHFIISSDGRFLAAAVPMAPEIHLWSMETRDRKVDLAGHPGGETRPRAFSPDGKSFASSGADSTVKLWDVETGEELLTLGRMGPIRSCRFSPDGNALVTISGTGPSKPGEIRIWLAAEDEVLPKRTESRIGRTGN